MPALEKSSAEQLPAPLLNSESKDSNVSFQYAGFWHRTLADIVDAWLLLVAGFALIAPFWIFAFTYILAPKLVVPIFSDRGGWLLLGLMLVPAILGFLLPWLYVAGLESSRHQATFGKQCFGLKVTNEAGENIGFFKSSLKLVLIAILTVPPVWIAKGFAELIEYKILPQIAPVIIASFLFSWFASLIPLFCTLYMLFNQRKQTVFDKLSKRLVLVHAKPNLRKLTACVLICLFVNVSELVVVTHFYNIAKNYHNAKTDAKPNG